jgi:hypothetical protein
MHNYKIIKIRSEHFNDLKYIGIFNKIGDIYIQYIEMVFLYYLLFLFH